VQSEYLHEERFSAPVAPKVSATSPCKLTIFYEGEKHVCEVASGQTLLEAALDEGVDIPYSCSSGMCNMCRARCTAGKVRMLEDEGLSQEELDKGYVLTCVGFPSTDEVVIEVD
jgi:ring-1,2-phenylacetyl-CoA epoxidase subunit PaaE